MIKLFDVDVDVDFVASYKNQNGNPTGEFDLALDIRGRSYQFSKGKGVIAYMSEQEYQGYQELQRMLGRNS